MIYLHARRPSIAGLHGLRARPKLLEGAQSLPSSLPLGQLLELDYNAGHPAEVGQRVFLLLLAGPRSLLRRR
jgi:hypothetical protein